MIKFIFILTVRINKTIEIIRINNNKTLFPYQKDPFKLKTGGLVQMKSVKDRNRDRTYEDVDRDVTNLGSTFSQETNRRDEDAEL